MSAIALNLLKRLRESGMDEPRAQQIAEAFDMQLDEVLRESKKHAEEITAQAAEKAKSQFVSGDEFKRQIAETPTRAENESQFAQVRAETKNEFAKIRAETKDEFAKTRAETKDEFAKVHEEIKDHRAETREESARNRATQAKHDKEFQYLRWGIFLILGILLTDIVQVFIS